MKAVSDALQRRSKQSLIDWLAQPLAMEPFKGDDRALRALHELQQLLVFERAFGLKAESGMRNELLLFAESQHESFRLRSGQNAINDPYAFYGFAYSIRRHFNDPLVCVVLERTLQTEAPR